MRDAFVFTVALVLACSVARADQSANPFLAAFSRIHLPGTAFDEIESPRAPDYGDASSWAALPDRLDASDVAPVGVRIVDPEKADADVFFIHPTTLLSSDYWNQDLSDTRTNAWTDAGPMHSQASAFNGCCRVYAPRYRQSGLSAQSIYSADSVKARALAYADIKRAFRYYMAHYNHGRPFIIASHSQGSRHSLNFIPEVIDNTPLVKQFVAAYTIGAWIPESWFSRMKDIKPCERGDDTGCVVTWSTLAEGADARAQRRGYGRRDGQPLGFADRGFVCINPLSWSRAPELAPASLNLGGWTRNGSMRPRPADPGLVSARCDNGAVFVSEPRAPGYRNGLLPGGNYHNYDYGLFYMNIRKNASDRVKAFVAARQ